MLKNIKILLVIFLSVSFVGCDDLITDVEVDDSYMKPKLVVHCYLSESQDTIFASVSKSKPIFSKKYREITEFEKPLKKATVKLYNNDTQQELILPFNEAKGKFAIPVEDAFLGEENIYTLNVAAPQMKSVSASCKIPKKLHVDIQNIKVSKTNDINTTNKVVLSPSFKFKDNAAQDNYYITVFKLNITYDTKNHSKYTTGINVKTEDVIIQQYLFSDRRQNGENIFVEKPIDFLSHYDRNNVKCSKVGVALYSVTKAYYDYARTVENQKNNTDSGPFVEPTIIVSNIKNGLGVFGGYTFVEKEKVFD